MGDEGRGRLEAVGRLTPTVGIEFRGKRIPRGAKLIRGRTGKLMRGAEPGVLGGGVEEFHKGRERNRLDKGWNS